jgi:hypothetical protein
MRNTRAPSRKTLCIFFAAALLFVVPNAFYAGERSDCENAKSWSQRVQPSDTQDAIGFDMCTAVDFGMTDWIKYSFLGGIVVLVGAAVSYRRDNAKPNLRAKAPSAPSP